MRENGALHTFIYLAIPGAMRGSVHGAVHGAVRGAIGGAVSGALSGAVQQLRGGDAGNQRRPGVNSLAPRGDESNPDTGLEPIER